VKLVAVMLPVLPMPAVELLLAVLVATAMLIASPGPNRCGKNLCSVGCHGGVCIVEMLR
jgi:hypothetical protein